MILFLSYLIIEDLNSIKSQATILNYNINNIQIKPENQMGDLRQIIINRIEEEHSKIHMQIHFRTDIKGNINLEH